MKKLIVTVLFAMGIISYGYSQNEIDALRYSYVLQGGTSRTNAMAGSFGALGADASMLYFNPAGMGIYKSSEFTITPSFELTNIDADYLGQNGFDYHFGANLNNLALIGTINFNNSDFKNINFGFAYNRLNSFNENVIIEGQNDQNSITDWLAAKGDGVSIEDLGYGSTSFYTNLAWEAYLIDPANDPTTSYQTMFNRYGQTQRRMINRTGYQGEYSFSMSGNIRHKLFLGVTLGVQTVRYKENMNTEEDDTNNVIDEFKYLSLNEKLETSGSGVNFKIGFLYNPVEWLRFGGALHTPTFFSLSDKYKTSLESRFDTNLTREDIIIDSQYGNYDYEIKTPSRFNASVGFIISKVALINVDYEYVNYSKIKLRADDYTFASENSTIKDIYKAVHNVKVGSEYRHGPVSFRLGFAYYGSPYKSDIINKDANTFVYSGGIGVRFDSTYLDFAYSRFTNKEYYGLYGGYGYNIDSPLAKIATNQNRFTVTLGFKF